MRIQIGLLLFPDLTQLDLTGPYEVFTKATDRAWSRDHVQFVTG